jgi:hypothetical protein
MKEKGAEDSSGTELDGRKVVSPIKRPDVLHVSDRPDVLESEKGSDLKKMKKARVDPNDLQAERGGLKVKDSDFKTE